MIVARLLLGLPPTVEITISQLELLEKLSMALPRQVEGLNLSDKEKAELKKLLTLKPDPADDYPREPVADTFTLCGVVKVLTREDRKESNPLASWELTREACF